MRIEQEDTHKPKTYPRAYLESEGGTTRRSSNAFEGYSDSEKRLRVGGQSERLARNRRFRRKRRLAPTPLAIELEVTNGADQEKCFCKDRQHNSRLALNTHLQVVGQKKKRRSEREALPSPTCTPELDGAT